jgi:hypothetical protein
MTVRPAMRRWSRSAHAAALLGVPWLLLFVVIGVSIMRTDPGNGATGLAGATLIAIGFAPLVFSYLTSLLGPLPGNGWMFEDVGISLRLVGSQVTLMRGDQPLWTVDWADVETVLVMSDGRTVLHVSGDPDERVVPRSLDVGRILETGQIVSVADLLASRTHRAVSTPE